MRHIGRALLTIARLDTRFTELITATFKLAWAWTLWYSLTHVEVAASPIMRMLYQSGLPVFFFIVLLGTFAVIHMVSALSNHFRYTATAIAAMFWGVLALLNLTGDGWPSAFLFFFIMGVVNAWAHLRLYLLRETPDE
jgi:hypothetical protein